MFAEGEERVPCSEGDFGFPSLLLREGISNGVRLVSMKSTPSLGGRWHFDRKGEMTDEGRSGLQ